ncbi:hypothetical protein GALMADRAFT_207525 [Galerina marginata CBS 339.88]|uniref:Uncharacterized protein n=1 Tax=Galerina marginata (strain CBS 339.88) TaxID=685588 RepID=A0A067TQN1_GALM3|nr:hypothetical protein GALMADRAFT_207525 [Galerina marginata CBS 339.88]
MNFFHTALFRDPYTSLNFEPLTRSAGNRSRTVAECQRELDNAQAAYDAVKRKRNLANGQLPDFKVSAKSRLEAAKVALKNAEKPRHDPELGNHTQTEPTAVMKTVMGAISSFCDVPNSTLKVKKEIVASLLPEGDGNQITIDVDVDESVGDEDAPRATNTDPELMEIDRVGEDNAGIQHVLSMEEKRVEQIALDAVENSDGAQETPVQISADTQETSVSANLAPSQAPDQTGICAQDAPLPSLLSFPIAHLHDMDIDKLEAQTMQVDRPEDSDISLQIKNPSYVGMAALSIDASRMPSESYSNQEISLGVQSPTTSNVESLRKPAYHAEIDFMSVDRMTVDGRDESNIEVDRPSVLVPQVKDLGAQRADTPAATPVDNASDEMIQKLMSAAPDLFFKMPSTVEEFLNYKFTFSNVDWDDISTPLALRTLDETDKDYKMRRGYHIREYEYNDRIRQQDHLNSVYDALEELFNDGKFPPKIGQQLLATLDANKTALSRTILDLQKRYEDTKAEYDLYKTRRHGEAEVATLKKRVAELKKAMFTVDSSKLIATRMELDAEQASLQKIIDKDVAAGGGGGKAKGGWKKKAEPSEVDNNNGDNGEVDETDRRELKYLVTDEAEEGQRAIQEYLNATTEQGRQRALNDSLRVGLRRTVREVQEFLPESSYASKEIAVQVHLASSKNFLCRYHSYFRGDSHAGWDCTDRLTGMGYPKRLCSQSNGVFAPKPGHMHCGCGIDEVLLEFFFWKNLTAFSSNPKLSSISFSMGDREFIPPRLRSFWVNHFKATTGITINDLYSRDAREVGWITHLTAKSLLFQMNALNARGFSLALAFKSAEDEEHFKQVVEG